MERKTSQIRRNRQVFLCSSRKDSYLSCQVLSQQISALTIVEKKETNDDLPLVEFFRTPREIEKNE